MTIFLHRFTGVLPAGDVWGIGWHSNSGATVDTSHGNAVTWITDLWNGVGLAAGLHGDYTAGTIVQKAITTQIDPVTLRTVATRETDFSLPGTNGANSLPQHVAIVVTLRSGLSGRHGRGRMYLPAPNVADTTAAGELAGATITSMMSSFNSAWATVNPAGEQPVVYNRATGVFQVIQRFGIGTVFDTQRRRTNKLSTVRSFDPMP
jgi:hypothetical protein